MYYSIGVANATIIRSYADSEENQTDKDQEYREEYRDDYTEGAISYPTSQHLLRMANIELLLLYFIVIFTL